MIAKRIIQYTLGSEEHPDVSVIGTIIDCIFELSLKSYREYRNNVRRTIQELYTLEQKAG